MEKSLDIVIDAFQIYILATPILAILVSEFWNLQTNPRTDIQWYLRFLGITIGLFSASEAYDTVNILFSPMASFALTPNEMNLIKHNSQE